MTRARASKKSGTAACTTCGGSIGAHSPESMALPAALVLVGSVVSFYLVGLAVLAVGVWMALKRDRCVCASD